MTDITQTEAEALVKVLSLAENHQMWSDPTYRTLPGFSDEQYAAITAVRAFLKRNDIMTLHEFTQQLAATQAALSNNGERSSDQG